MSVITGFSNQQVIKNPLATAWRKAMKLSTKNLSTVLFEVKKGVRLCIQH